MVACKGEADSSEFWWFLVYILYGWQFYTMILISFHTPKLAYLDELGDQKLPHMQIMLLHEAKQF